MQISTPEMTAFDLVCYMNASGHINHVATIIFCELAEQLNPNILAELLKRNNVAITSAQRLGYLLEKLQLAVDLGPLENQLKKNKVTRRPLVAGSDQPIIEYVSTLAYFSE